MDTLKNYLSVLEDGLNKKLVVLSKLISLTDQQSMLLKSENFREDDFQELVTKKAEQIECLEQLDEGFQTLYDRIKDNLEPQRQAYKEQIAALQVKIRMVIDQSMTLERKERANEPHVSEKFSVLRKEAREIHRSRNLATSYYKSMNRISDEPSFMDEKK